MTAHPLQAFVDQLLMHTSLTDEEQSALFDLPSKAEGVINQTTIVGRDEVVETTCVVVNGLFARTSYTRGGDRQFTSFYVKGDMPDLHTLMRPRATFGLPGIVQ
jgi:hypothetical protein